MEEANITVTQVAHERPARNRLHLQAIWEAGQEARVEIGLLGYIIWQSLWCSGSFFICRTAEEAPVNWP
jgi:hypothetical protein